MAEREVDRHMDARDTAPTAQSARRFRYFSLESAGQARCRFWKLVSAAECLRGWHHAGGGRGGAGVQGRWGVHPTATAATAAGQALR